MLKEHIAYIKTKYKSRIAQSQFELKRKIALLEEEHRLWVDKQEEACQKRVLDIEKDYESRKVIEVLAPSLDLCLMKEDQGEFQDIHSPDLDIPSPELVSTPQVHHATACLFNLSSPECSIQEDDLLMNDDDILSCL